MKKVFNKSTEVAHLWANQTQAEARNSSDNFRFDGMKVYSYAMEIACLRETPDRKLVVFVNRSEHRHTTRGHQSDVLVASNQYPQFAYNDDRQYAKIKWSGEDSNAISGRVTNVSPSLVSPIEIWEQYYDLSHEIVSSSYEKKFSRTKTQRLAEAQALTDMANELRELFELDVPVLALERTAEQEAEMVSYAETKRLLTIAERKALALKLQVERGEWIAGTRHYFPQSDKLDVCLRLNPSDPDEVQTSRSATVPTKVCRRLWQAFRSRQMPENTSVGNFRLNDVNADGLTIGCHHITATELTRFAKVLWPDEA